MESRQFPQSRLFAPLILILIVGTAFGVSVGYLIWSRGAENYSIISKSEEAQRTVRIDKFSITFPSVIICKTGKDTSRTITITNLDNEPEHIVVFLSLVHSSGVDSATISALTGNPYRATIAAYGSADDVLSFKPSSKGYAIFDLTVKEELAGSITLYVVS